MLTQSGLVFICKSSHPSDQPLACVTCINNPPCYRGRYATAFSSRMLLT